MKIGKGAEMQADLQADLQAAGILIASRDDEPQRVAELRATPGLKLPDCCVLDAAGTNDAKLATFDRALATAARRRLRDALMSARRRPVTPSLIGQGPLPHPLGETVGDTERRDLSPEPVLIEVVTPSASAASQALRSYIDDVASR